MPGDNIIMLQTVASGLGDLVDEMVFVRGAVAELYADDPASSDDWRRASGNFKAERHEGVKA